MKRLMTKTALAAAIVVGSIAGIGVDTAGATRVYDGAIAVSFSFLPNAHSVNMDVAPAFGPSNLINHVHAGSTEACQGCNALAVSVQVDLVSFTTTPPNESDVARVADKGNGDQDLAAAAMFVVTAPGRVNLSESGWDELASVKQQLRDLSLVGSSTAAVQGNINALLGQVIGILQTRVTTTSPAASAIAPTGGVQITSNIQFDG